MSCLTSVRQQSASRRPRRHSPQGLQTGGPGLGRRRRRCGHRRSDITRPLRCRGINTLRRHSLSKAPGRRSRLSHSSLGSRALRHRSLGGRTPSRCSRCRRRPAAAGMGGRRLRSPSRCGSCRRRRPLCTPRPAARQTSPQLDWLATPRGCQAMAAAMAAADPGGNLRHSPPRSGRCSAFCGVRSSVQQTTAVPLAMAAAAHGILTRRLRSQQHHNGQLGHARCLGSHSTASRAAADHSVPLRSRKTDHACGALAMPC